MIFHVQHEADETAPKEMYNVKRQLAQAQFLELRLQGLGFMLLVFVKRFFHVGFRKVMGTLEL